MNANAPVHRRHLPDVVSEQGSAAVEFVFVGILITFLTLGVFQLALTLHVRNTVHDAASEGARWAALADSTPQEGVQRTKDLITVSVGSQFAQDVTATTSMWLDAPTAVITVRTSLPVIGLWGFTNTMEVQGHAATEIIG